MDLKIKDVAELLNVSETTIRRWLSEGKIPAYRLHHQYRFSRIEIENWMMSCRLNKGKKVLTLDEAPIEEDNEELARRKGMQHFSLYRAIHLGGVILEVESTSKEQVIRETMQKLSETLSIDAEVVSNLLLEREKLMPTALNHGIAVPHTRDFLLEGPSDIVAVVMPPEPIDWGALDGKPVHSLFFLFASDDKRHLHLLAKIAHLSSSDEALELLRSRPDKKELLSYIKEWESNMKSLQKSIF